MWNIFDHLRGQNWIKATSFCLAGWSVILAFDWLKLNRCSGGSVEFLGMFSERAAYCVSFETEGWRESRSGAEGVGTIDLKPSEMVNGWVWYFLKHKKGIARKLHPFYSYRITRTAKLSRRKSLQAAQKKQEMKAEETGSAHRKLCQCFEHSNRKDIMGEDVKKNGEKGFLSAMMTGESSTEQLRGFSWSDCIHQWNRLFNQSKQEMLGKSRPRFTSSECRASCTQK